MLYFQRGLLAAALALAAPCAAQAVDWSATVSFGDSLTDNRGIGGTFAPGGLDPTEAAFTKAAAPASRLTNYAVGGSRSNDIFAQIVRYAQDFIAGRQPLATTITFEIGGNDILFNYGTLAAAPPGTNARGDALINQVLANIANDLTLLYQLHPQATFVVWTIPDVTSTPLHWRNRNSTGAANVRAHVERINGILRLLNGAPNIVVYDSFVEIQTLSLNPPVLRGRSLIAPPTFGLPACLFADLIHPTAVGNALIANTILVQLATRFGGMAPVYTENELANLAQLP